ncbi:MAG TPA: AzlD domain-containing protein [Clostridia bacterium]|nr:AzlD domain-containing protein [Clostridia bacterium]
MTTIDYLLIIAGMTIVTYVPRAFPLVAFSQRPIPPLLQKWLSFVPVAILAALLGPSILIPGGSWELTLTNKFLLAAIPTFIVAFRTKSLVATVLIGMACSAALSFLL